MTDDTPSLVFTGEAFCIMDSIQSVCHISAAWDKNSGRPKPQQRSFRALWDTGATNSGISSRVVRECRLTPSGQADIRGVNEKSRRNTYVVNLDLPFEEDRPLPVVVAELELSAFNFDVIIGMDIISQGSLLITNSNGITKYLFQIPSAIDIVKDGGTVGIIGIPVLKGGAQIS